MDRWLLAVAHQQKTGNSNWLAANQGTTATEYATTLAISSALSTGQGWEAISLSFSLNDSPRQSKKSPHYPPVHARNTTCHRKQCTWRDFEKKKIKRTFGDAKPTKPKAPFVSATDNIADVLMCSPMTPNPSITLWQMVLGPIRNSVPLPDTSGTSVENPFGSTRSRSCDAHSREHVVS